MGAKAAERESGRMETGKPGEWASEYGLKENGKPEAAFSVLELVGGRTAAMVKLPGKLINSESRFGSLE